MTDGLAGQNALDFAHSNSPKQHLLWAAVREQKGMHAVAICSLE